MATVQIARRAAYAALGSSSSAIEEYMKRHPDEDGIVVGDETRLRQIVTNLARWAVPIIGPCHGLTYAVFESNACKFTQTGGKISVSTKLITPVLPHKTAPSTSDIARAPPMSGDDKLPSLSSSHLSEHDLHTQSKLPLDWIAVRIEVSDTGCGIQRADMVGCKLFCKFHATLLSSPAADFLSVSRIQSDRNGTTARHVEFGSPVVASDSSNFDDRW